jgi:TonB family protein
MTPLARALSSALLHFVWQGVVVALVLSVVLVLLRRRSAQARYVASCAALAIMAVSPVVTMWAAYRGPAAVTATAVAAVAQASTVVLAAPVGTWVVRLDARALPVWSLGVLFFALRLMWGSRQVSTLRRRGETAEEAVLAVAASVAARLGLARPVHVLMSALAEGPGVVGWIRPVILLPAATLAGLTPQQFEAVLAHEIAHILRYDYLVNLLQMLVEALLFYHPAVWWVSGRIRHERELCCDDVAVRACGDAVCYARALTSLERLRAQAPALAMGSTSGRLLYRIERLMGAAPQEQSPARWPGIVALAAGLVCVALTTNWARGQAPVPPDQAGVKVDLGKSSVVNRTGVTYPQAAQTKGVKGEVTVQVTVDENGNVSDARVVKGPEELRKGVLQSVLNWKFAQDAAKSKQQVKVEFQPPPPGTATPAKDPAAANAVADTQANLERQMARYEALQRAGVISDEQVRRERDTARQESIRSAEDALSFLEQQVAEAQKLRETARSQTSPNEFSVFEAERQLQRAQRQMAAAQLAAELAKAAQAQAEQAVKEGALAPLEAVRTQAALAARQAELAHMKEELAQMTQAVGVRQLVGKTVKDIQMTGFTDAVSRYLTSGMNLHAGDTLTAESIQAARRAVHDYDENVKMEFTPTDDGQVTVHLVEAALRQ